MLQSMGLQRVGHELATEQEQRTKSNNTCGECTAQSCCSVTKSCPTLCSPMDCSTPGFRVPQHLPEFAQTHIKAEIKSPETLLGLFSPRHLLYPVPGKLTISSSFFHLFFSQKVTFLHITKSTICVFRGMYYSHWKRP